MKHILITSYGIDSALAQILFYSFFKEDAICVTATRETITKILDSFSSLIESKIIVLGFPENVCEQYDCTVIPFSLEKSLTLQLALMLHLFNDPKAPQAKYVFLSNKLKKYDQSVDSFREYYTAVGHDNFINEFKNSNLLSLTKGKIGMAKAYVSNLQNICDVMVENESTCEDGIAVCKNVFNGSVYLEDSLIQKYYNENDPSSLIIMALWSIDKGKIRITVKGRSGFGKTVCKMFPKEYQHPYDETSIYVPLSDIEHQTISEICRNVLLNKVTKALENERSAYFDKFHKLSAQTSIMERRVDN